jgi:hypothetical protein
VAFSKIHPSALYFYALIISSASTSFETAKMHATLTSTFNIVHHAPPKMPGTFNTFSVGFPPFNFWL